MTTERITPELSQQPLQDSAGPASPAGEAALSVPVRLDFDSLAPGFSTALGRLEAACRRELDRAGIDGKLRELLRLRASQINGCAYCIDMHSKDARACGETQQRLDVLPAWRDAPFFTGAERAALAFTEAVTRLSAGGVGDEVFSRVSQHFTAEQVAALLSLIVMINAWNAVGATAHCWEVGSYQP